MKPLLAIALLIFSLSAISDQKVALRANYESLVGSEIYSEYYDGLSNASVDMGDGSNVYRGTMSSICKKETIVRYQSKERYEEVVVTSYCDLEYFGEPENRTSRLPNELQGTTIIVERIGGIWRHRLAKGMPSVEQKRSLRRRESRYDRNDLYPDRPVKVGDVWEIPVGALPIVVGFTLVNVTGTGTGRLQELVDYGGTPSALIVMEGRFKGKDRDVGDGIPNAVDVTVLVEEYRTLKDQITRYAKVEGEARFSQEEIVEGQKRNLTVSGPFTYIVAQHIR